MSQALATRPPVASPTWSPRPLLPPGWPLVVGFVGYPLAWALGFGPLVWPALLLPMALHLLHRRDLVVPRGFGLWMLLLLWMVLSGTQVSSVGDGIGFAYRLSQYLAATLVLVLAYNLPPGFTAGHGRRLLRYTFAAVTVGGLVALVAPRLALPSLALEIMPGAISSDAFVRDLFTPAVAQVQDFLGFDLPRPAAPFTYTNTWGAAYALLFPWVLADILEPGPGRQRRRTTLLLLVSLVPAVVSVNRAMWISIAAALVLLVATTHDARVQRAVRALVVAVPVLLVVAALSPLGALVQDRLTTPHSNDARVDVATATTDALAESPLLGFGGPEEYQGPGIRPALGTQGQMWLVMFAHGYPALVAYLAFFVVMWRRLRPSPQRTWARMMLLAMAIHLPFYAHLGVPLIVVMFALGLALRPVAGRHVAGAGAGAS